MGPFLRWNDTGARPRPAGDVAHLLRCSLFFSDIDSRMSFVVPENDRIELAGRLKGIVGIPRVLAESADEIPLGTEATFWVGNVDSRDEIDDNTASGVREAVDRGLHGDWFVVFIVSSTLRFLFVFRIRNVTIAF